MRFPTMEEATLVKDSLEGAEYGLFERFLSGKELACVDRDDDVLVVLADDALFDLPDALIEDAMAGLPVGIINEEGFALGLQGAVIFARETRKSTVTVQEKGSHHFLYGKDVFGTMVLGFDPRLVPGTHAVVTNPRHEAIGIGLVVGRFKGNRPAVRPLHDLGHYLRNQ